MVINREPLGGGHQKGADGEMVIKRELMGWWSSKWSWWGGERQKGTGGEVVIKRELVGRWSSKGC